MDIKTKIEKAFPFVKKPNAIHLVFHPTDCHQCDYLREDLAGFVGKELPSDAIREIHQEMSCLSAEGWAWALPSYLRFCLTDEAAHNQMETEFLIYNLGPEEEYREETMKRLSGLNGEQLECLIEFLYWCNTPPHWAAEYCGDNIEKAISFVKSLNA